MTTPPTNKPAADTPLAKPTTPNETDPDKLLEEFDMKVWDKDGPIKIVSIKRGPGPDEYDFHLANGNGHISFQNGNLVLISGTNGSPTNPCGGKLVVKNSGEIRKSEGSINIEATASSSEQENLTANPDSQEPPAYSIKCYGPYSVEAVGGTVGIKGTDVVITAAGMLTLVGESGVNIQAGKTGGGTINMSGGKFTKTVSTEEEIIVSQKTKIVSEDSTFQYDPRASVNIVSPGHMNIKAAGDISFGAGGIIDSYAAGKPPTGLPLVKDRTATYKIRALKAEAYGISIDAIQGEIGINATAGGVDILGTTDVTIGSSANVVVTGAMIMLN